MIDGKVRDGAATGHFGEWDTQFSRREGVRSSV